MIGTSAWGQVISKESAGPLVGSVSSSDARILFRNSEKSEKLKIIVSGPEQQQLAVTKKTNRNDDFVAKFHLKGLKPETRYTYMIFDEKNRKLLPKSGVYKFSTIPSHRNNKFTAAVVSCVNETTEGVWKEVRGLAVDMLCLNGDTPYIDSTSLEVARKKHRTLLGFPQLKQLISQTSTLGNWDDHDFGANNANGHSFRNHKHKTLIAFKNYRANQSFGYQNKEGIYHKSDHGVIEFFHLDQRYFAKTEPSPVDKTQPTCFGKHQWKWLLKSLKESKAAFKVLSIGAIWEDKKNRETDDMFTYWYERDALFDFIKDNGITGVVLVGGDIHLSRHLIHPKRVGYDLHDFVMSPGHDETIKQLDVFHPSLEWSLVESHQFLLMSADGSKKDPELTVQYRQPGGQVNREVRLTLSQLTPPKPRKGLERGLKASWNFDKDFKNRSLLGGRLNAMENGDVVLTENGIKGRAVSLERSKGQFLNVRRSVLDETSSSYSVSFWLKPKSLPMHGTAERQFFLESTAQGNPNSKPAYCMSLGMRTSSAAENVVLEIYTHTLQPAQKIGLAPTAMSQGGFRFQVPRKLLSNRWSHIVATFDSRNVALFLNGKMLGTHKLPISGPCSEHGGLIIGGHRAGIGRNYDGYMDEIGIWGRKISQNEILELYRKKEVPSVHE